MVSIAKISHRGAIANSGTYTAPGQVARPLNTIKSDPDNIVASLSSNQFTLVPGKYLIQVFGLCHFVQDAIMTIENVTDSQRIGLSNNLFGNDVLSNPWTWAVARSDVTQNTTYEIGFNGDITRFNDAFGESNTLGQGDGEVYCDVLIEQLEAG